MQNCAHKARRSLYAYSSRPHPYARRDSRSEDRWELGVSAGDGASAPESVWAKGDVVNNNPGDKTEPLSQTRPHSPRAKEDALGFVPMPSAYERTKLVKRILETAVRLELIDGSPTKADAYQWAIELIDKEVLKWGDGEKQEKVA